MPQGYKKASSESISSDRLSNEELVRLCLRDDRQAWNEFFLRFTPLIKNTIRKRFVRASMFRLSNDIDTICDIHLLLVDKLYGKKELKLCRNTASIKTWLITTTRNTTSDWIRAYLAKKNAPDRIANESMDSLNRKTHGEGNEEFLDRLKSDDGFGREETAVDTIWKEMEQIENPRSFWALRLSVMAYEPLSIEEIEDLAQTNCMPISQIQESLKKMQKTLDKKSKEKIDAEVLAAKVFCEIREFEYQLNKAGKEGKKAILKEIADARKLHTKHLGKMNKVNRPTNKQIAEMVGLDREQVGQVTNILIRARERITYTKGKSGEKG